MKKAVILMWVLMCSICQADPAPFGLELGKTTIAEAKAQYTLTSAGTNKFSNGEMFSMDLTELNFEGLESILLVFEKDETLAVILTTFPKHKFGYLMKSLSKKYQLINKKIPFVGNKSAKFHDGKTEIILDAPHLSFEMSMIYTTDVFTKRMDVINNEEEQQRKQQESSQL